MSAHAALAEALVDVLIGHAPLGMAINGVFDAPPVRAVRPYAVVEDAVLADWSTKDMAGREGRLTVMLFDIGEGPKRLRGLADEVVAAVEAMPRELAEGWHVASLIFLRSRIVHEGERRWAAIVEWRVRMLRVN